MVALGRIVKLTRPEFQPLTVLYRARGADLQVGGGGRANANALA